MDRKSIFIVLFCLVALVGWNILVNKLYPPRPVSPVATNVVTSAESPAATNAVEPGGVTPVAPPVTTTETPTTLVIDTNTPEQLLIITNQNARYTFTSHGGGLKHVELVGASTRRELESGRVPTLNLNAPTPAFTLVGGESLQGDGVFELSRTATGVRAEKRLPNGLLIVKEFAPGSNYLVRAVTRIENQSTQALALPPQHWVIGTATPVSAQDDSSAVGFMWHDGDKARDTIGSSYFSRTSFCMPRTPPDQFTAGQSNVVWFAVHNQFFSIAAIPGQPALHAVAREVPLPPPSAEELEENPRSVRAPVGYEAALVFPAAVLGPEQALEREFQVYAGPKEYRILAKLGNNLDAIMAFGRFFGFFSKALLLGMNWLHTLGLSYGWAIIVITIIIKILFWPLTQASTRSMKRMQALQPQMKALQEKFKDDPLKAQRKMMEFMKENKVNPMGGCLPMLLQMPVFIGFFYMIRSAIELRGASFLWVVDLSRPDTLFFIPGIGFPFNLLPLLMGATMLWQAHLTPPSPGMDPMQQKILRYMPLLFMVFLYNFSAGLTLYWTVQNLLTIAQTKLTKTRVEPVQPVQAPAKAPALTRPQKKKK